MRLPRSLGLLCVWALWLVTAPAGALSEDLRQRALADLRAAAEDMQAKAVHGGYAGITDLRDGSRYGESRIQPLTPTMIWIQPPGTPSVGQCFLRAYQTTGDRGYLDAATATGAALASAQLRNGGWDYVADLAAAAPGEPGATRKDGKATLDDDTTQGALAYLIDLDRELHLPWTGRAVREGIEFLLRAQHDNGGWPQAFPPSGNYKDHDTFNDGAINNTIAVLLRAYDVYGDPRYLDAALRGGGFILKTQLPAPQSGWAQQYDAAGRPAMARSFEPAALSPETTATNARTLMELYLRTGDERYRASIDKALAWLERVRIAPELWPRYSEIGTDKPLYTDRTGRRYDSPELLPSNVQGYRWQGAFGIPRLEADHADLGRLGRERYLAEREARRQREPAVRARAAAQRLPPLLADFAERRAWIDNGELRSRSFVRNCNLILDLAEGAR